MSIQGPLENSRSESAQPIHEPHGVGGSSFAASTQHLETSASHSPDVQPPLQEVKTAEVIPPKGMEIPQVLQDFSKTVKEAKAQMKETYNTTVKSALANTEEMVEKVTLVGSYGSTITGRIVGMLHLNDAAKGLTKLGGLFTLINSTFCIVGCALDLKEVWQTKGKLKEHAQNMKPQSVAIDKLLAQRKEVHDKQLGKADEMLGGVIEKAIKDSNGDPETALKTIRKETGIHDDSTLSNTEKLQNLQKALDNPDTKEPLVKQYADHMETLDVSARNGMLALGQRKMEIEHSHFFFDFVQTNIVAPVGIISSSICIASFAVAVTGAGAVLPTAAMLPIMAVSGSVFFGSAIAGLAYSIYHKPETTKEVWLNLRGIRQQFRQMPVTSHTLAKDVAVYKDKVLQAKNEEYKAELNTLKERVKYIQEEQPGLSTAQFQAHIKNVEAKQAKIQQKIEKEHNPTALSAQKERLEIERGKLDKNQTEEIQKLTNKIDSLDKKIQKVRKEGNTVVAIKEKLKSSKAKVQKHEDIMTEAGIKDTGRKIKDLPKVFETGEEGLNLFEALARLHAADTMGESTAEAHKQSTGVNAQKKYEKFKDDQAGLQSKYHQEWKSFLGGGYAEMVTVFETLEEKEKKANG